MAIPTVYAPAYFTGNNSTSTAYVCNFKALDKANLRVIATAADGTESSVLSDGSGITVTLVGNTVEFTTTAAYDNTYTITAFLTSDFLQSRNLQNSGNNDVNVREDMFDKLTLMLQIALAGVSETSGIPISFPSGEAPATFQLPAAPNRASSLLYFDVNGALTTLLYSTLVSDLIALFNTGSGDAADALSNQVVTISSDTNLTMSNAFRTLLIDDSSGDVTLTVLQDSAATVPVGTKWDVVKNSASNESLLVAGSGATLNSAEGADPKLSAQYAGSTIVKVAANTYYAFGRLVGS